MTEERDHVDRFIESIQDEMPFDPVVEGIVDRIGGLSRRLHRMMDETLADRGLSYGEYKLLGHLRHQRPEHRLSAGRLAEWAELTSGAMTNRIDRLEKAGLVKRVPDPNDRRGILVELTDDGRHAYDEAVGAQSERENRMTAALDAREKDQLNALLRRLMLTFEAEEEARKKHR